MTRKLPPEVGEQVLTLWLQAYSRDDIAKIVGLGSGTVSDIVKDYNRRHPGFELLREFVVAIRKEGSNIRHFAPAVRLQRLPESQGLTAEHIESFIVNASIHCFKRNEDLNKFIGDVNKTADLANKTEVPVEDLPVHIEEMERKLQALTMAVLSKKEEEKEAVRKCNAAQTQLGDSIAKAQTIKYMQFKDSLRWDNQTRLLRYAISQWSWETFCRNLLAQELAEANRKLYGNFDQVKNHQSTATKSAHVKSTTN